MPESAPTKVFSTPRCINAIQQATKLAARHGQSNVNAGHLLLAILADCRSAPSRVMDSMRINRGECIRHLLRELGMAGESSEKSPATSATATTNEKEQTEADIAQSATAPSASQNSVKASLESLTRDLTKMAREGKLQPAIGRNAEIFEIIQVLSRKSKNNVMIVGEAGVGKTQIFEGIALNIAQGGTAADLMPHYRILELNIAALMSGTQYTGVFEEKLLSLLEQLKQDPNTLLFIDEAHLIMGAGATEGDGMNMANLLKPALARGELRCIGATTLDEYRKHIEKDAAFERRFQPVYVDEPGVEETIAILRGLKDRYEAHHGVRILDSALVAAGVLRFPDAVHLVAERARAMQAAVPEGEGAMAAVLGRRVVVDAGEPALDQLLDRRDVDAAVVQVLVEVGRIDAPAMLGGDVNLATEEVRDRAITHVDRVPRHRLRHLVGQNSVQHSGDGTCRTTANPPLREVPQHDCLGVLRLDVAITKAPPVGQDDLNQWGQV